MTGNWPERFIDHKDQNKTNNKWDNLRLATKGQNSMNRGVQPNNKLGFRGVCESFGKYEALVAMNGKKVFRRRFDTVEEAVYCQTGKAYYYSFVGWSDIYIMGFALNPGDLFYTEVHAFGGCNNGSAFVEDLTTLTYGSYTIDNDCAVPQVGNSANWIVDRICCDGPNPDGVWPLANTAAIFFDGGAVENGSGALFYPGSQASTTQVLTMTDDAGDQSIELVNQGSTGYEGEHGLLFQTTGCAWSGGCTP